MTTKNSSDQKKERGSKKKKAIVGYILAVILPILVGYYWPAIDRLIFDTIKLSVTIQPQSTILVEGKNLNLNLQAQVVNFSGSELKSIQFNCYSRKNTFWSNLPFVTKKGKPIGVLNQVPVNDLAKAGSLPAGAYGDYHLYLNVPMPDDIAKIRDRWIQNQYELTYQNLLDNLNLPPTELIITVQTNPLIEDETVLRLFKK